MAHLSCVLSSDDAALPPLQVRGFAGRGVAYLPKFSFDLSLLNQGVGGPWGWNPTFFITNTAPGMLLLLNSEK